MDRTQILDFLERIKETIKNKRFEVVPRDKNLDFLVSRDLGLSDVKTFIECLTFEDYSSGPESDHNGSGVVWIFKYEYIRSGGISEMLYIKLKVFVIGSCEYGKAISIHD